MAVASRYSFWQISRKEKNISIKKNNNFTTFIDLLYGISGRNMKIGIFSIMCHFSLGHRKKSLLNGRSGEIREFKQRRPRRQRERQKNNRFRLA